MRPHVGGSRYRLVRTHTQLGAPRLMALFHCSPQDGSHAKRRMGLNKEQMEAMNRVSLAAEGPARPTQLSLAPPSASTSASASAATSPSPTPSTPADSGPAETRQLLGMLSSPPFTFKDQAH